MVESATSGLPRAKAASVFSMTSAAGVAFAEGGAALALDPAGKEDVAHARLDHPGGDVDRLQPRGAEPVHRAAGDRVGQPGEQGGHAGDVAVVLAGLVGVAEVDVVDQRRVDFGALNDGLEDQRGQV